MVRRAVSLAIVLASFGALMWPVPACSSFDEDTPAEPPPRQDACSADLTTDRENCGACGTRCGEKEYCTAGKCGPGCPQPVLYVSPSGKETNDGCSPETSKATIGGAIALVETQKLVDHEIHVCRGTYAENVVLRYPVTLRGGYECSTFQRTPAFGLTKIDQIFAEGFDKVNETRIETRTPAGLVITGSAVGRNVAVEGFYISGLQSAGNTTGVTIDAKASPTLRHNDIFGGKLDGSGDEGAVGISIDNEAEPLITSNRIVGGEGNAKQRGSIAVYVRRKAGRAIIAGNEIRSGKVTGTSAASIGGVGIWVDTPATLIDDAAIRGNGISCDGATATNPCFGVFLLGGSADVVDNRISLGSTVCTGSATQVDCGSYGIRSQVTGRAHIYRNRVHGGDAKGGAMTMFGISIMRGSEDEVVNNMVDPGTSKARHNGLALHARGRPPTETSPTVTRPLFAHNTVLLGDGDTAAGLYFDNLGITNIRIENNIFMGTPFKSVDAPAVFFAPCTGSSIETFRANAFLGVETTMRFYEGFCDAGGDTPTTDITTMETKLVNMIPPAVAANVRDNVAIKGTCSTPTRCTANPTCDTSNGCLSDMLAAWDPKFGTSTLFSTGWRLGPSTPCAVATGGITSPSVPKDFLDVARTDRPSIGAHEFNGPPCQ